MDLLSYIDHTFHPTLCDSETFFYNEMESQSGYCLPVIYQPFDPAAPSHWHDRGSLYDFLYSVDGEGKSLLDFGPGDGWPSLIVAPFAAQVTGVDGSPRRVEVCTQNAARLGLPNAKFIHVPPGSLLPFPDATFDGVMAASSIEQTPNPRAALAELYRVLKPGGRLRISYEGLARYQGGQENEADLAPIDDHSCWLTIYARDLPAELARMARLRLNLSVEEAARRFCPGGEPFTIANLTPEAMQDLQPCVSAALQCTLTHPSGATYARWLAELGFRQVLPTHSGAYAAWKLFEQTPEDQRPTGLAGVDALLRPLVKIVVGLSAPLQIGSRVLDPWITAVK